MANVVRARHVFSVLCLASLAGCGWVDETGRQSNTSPDIALDDSNLLTEGSTLSWSLQSFDADGNIASLRFNQTASGATVESCSDNFSPLEVAPTLRDACQPALTDEQCQVDFKVGVKDVVVTLPELRRPAALSYQVQVQDEDGATDARTIDLCIASVSAVPAVEDESYAVTYLAVLEQSGSRFDEQCLNLGGTGVLANDSDDFDYSEGWAAGQSCLRATLVDGPVYATSFELRENGGFTYQSSGAAGPGAQDTFTYRVSDGSNVSELATATIAITGDNEPPAALNPTLTTAEDVTLVIRTDELASDPEGTALKVDGFTQPSNGTVRLSSSDLNFVPNANFFGSTFFLATLVDASGLSVESRVDITVAEVNDKPIITGFPSRLAMDVSGTSTPTEFEWMFSVADEETAISSLAVSLQLNDAIADYRLEGPSTTGQMKLVMTPERDGSAVAVLRVTDLAQGSLAAQTTEISVAVSVLGLNLAPIAEDDAAELFKNGELTLSVLDNDVDPDGTQGSLRITKIVSGPEYGDVSIVGSGQLLQYISSTQVSVVDRIVYQIVDTDGAVAEATVVLTTINRAPVVAGESRDLVTSGSAFVDVLNNDSDPDGDTLSLLIVEGSYVGTASLLNGLLWYQAPFGYEGVVQVPYEVSDGDGGVSTGILVLNIQRSDSGR